MKRTLLICLLALTAFAGAVPNGIIQSTWWPVQVASSFYLLTGQTYGGSSTYTSGVGNLFKVSQNRHVTQIARMFKAGNSGSHTLFIAQGTLGFGTATILYATNYTASGTDGQYQWITLSTPLALTGGTQYMIGDANPGGDSITGTCAASVGTPGSGVTLGNAFYVDPGTVYTQGVSIGDSAIDCSSPPNCIDGPLNIQFTIP